MDSDDALFERLLRGDIGAFDQLYDRYERPLFGFIRAQLQDRAEAEDVFHEAFLAVLTQRKACSEIRSFRAWLFQVARNLCLNRIRSRNRASRALTASASEDLPFEQPAADKALESRQIEERLRAAVARLPASLAEIYQLRAAGLSYEELADVVRVPVGTIKSRMHDLLQRLREEMQT